MVAIVTGTGVGLERSSGWILGSKGMLGNAGFGRYGENVYVNAATGNLAITRVDEILIGQGPDDVLTRAYNSLGDNNDDNGDHWRLSAQRQITNLTGALNSSGSKIERVDWDGSHEVFTWDTTRNLYTFTGAAGSMDTLAYNSSDQSWTFTDGSNQATEHYTHIAKNNDTYFARIDTLSDTDGNTLTYTYAGTAVTDMMTRVTTTPATGTAEYTVLNWWPGTNDLKSLETHLQDGTVLTRTSYVYDTSHRLQTVTTDLSPNDSSTSDNYAVVTTYTYDGSSDRVASIKTGTPQQDNGTLLTITYDGSNRVHIITQTMDSGVTNTTTFTYDSSTQTTITDQLNQSVVLTYDGSNRLKSYTLASGQNTQFTYDSVSDNLKWIDPSSNTTYYAYDSNNNLVRQQDANGDAITYTYDQTTNALLTETRWYGRDTSPTNSNNNETDPHTTHYVYDGQNHLRFVISPLGEVTEYQYYPSGSIYGDGNRKDSFVYRDQTYSLTTYALNDLKGWADGLSDKSSVLHSHMTYDIRGSLSQITSYEAADAAGNGLGTATTVTYVYDQYGNLLSRQTSGVVRTEQFVYDGLGRMISSVDLANQTTAISFDDGLNTMTVQLADGLQRISTYNYAGQLVSYTEHGTGLTDATTSYAYDVLGRLLMVVDAIGNRHFYLRDSVGRVTADVTTNNALTDGTLVEYGYNASNQLVKTVRYFTRLTATQLTGLLSGGKPANPAVSTVRPAADDAHDVWQWRIYDTANRLIQTLDSAGDVTVLTYDGSSNLLSIQGYAGVLGSVAAYKTTTPTSPVSTPTATSFDTLTRNFYDDDGRLEGVLDGNGYLTQYRYDAAGEKIETIAYRAVVPSADRAAGTFAQLLTDVGTNVKDRHTRAFYDNRGLLCVTLDSVLRPCEYVYDEAGQLVQQIEYAGSISNPTHDALSDATTAIGASGLAAASDTRVTWHVYEPASGRLVYDISSIGAVTRYDYDDVLLTVKTTIFNSTFTPTTQPTKASMNSWASSHSSSSDRISRTIYDLKGRIAYTIDGSNYVTEYRYDLDDRKGSEIRYADAYGVDDTIKQSSLATLIGSTIPSTAIQTTFVYNFDGTLKDTYDGENVCTHFDYDGLGRVTARTVASGSSDQSKTVYEYDAAGRVATEKAAAGTSDESITTYAYNGMGEMTDKVQASGTPAETTTHYEYDDAGRLTAQTAAYNTSDASITAYAYNAFGEVTDRTEASGSTTDASVTHYDYDNFGRVTKETRGYTAAEASVTTYAYNAFNAVTDKTVAFGTDDAAVTHYVYDNAGRLQLRTEAYGVSGEASSTTYTYDAFDDTLTIKDALNYTTSFTYDNDGNVLTSARPIDATINAVTHYLYDAFGNVLRAIDPLNNASYFFYDKRNLQTLSVDEEGYATGTDYNARGEVTSVIRYFQKITGTITPGVPPTLTTDPSQYAKTSFDHDFLGRVTKVTDAENFYEQYTYDDLSNRLTWTNKLGGVVTYTYTKRGLLASETRPMSAMRPDNTTEATSISITYQYDLRGNRKQMVEAAGLTEQRTTNYAYDRLDRLTNTTHDQVQVVASDLKTVSTVTPTETSVYNARGEIIETIDAGGGKTFFYYDHRGNKTWQVNADGALLKFGYDLNDNLIAQRVYGDAVALPSSPGGTQPSPVDNTNYRRTTYTYDRSSRLLTTTVASVLTGAYDTTTSTYGTDTDAITVTNVYDLNGNLVQQTDGNNNSVFYYYDKLGRKIAQADQENYFTYYDLDADGNVTRETRYAYALTGNNLPTATSDPVALRNSLSTTANRVTNFTYDRNGRRLSEARTGTATYSVDSTTGALTQNAAGTDITISYAYNGLGEVIGKTEATGDTTTYTYDSFGRQTIVTKAAFTGYDGNTATQNVTTEKYDGLNNLVRTSEGGHVTTYTYGAGGRLASTTNAAGFTTNYEYDAAGRTVKASYSRTESDGTAVTEAQATRYDILGRVTFQAMASYDSTNNVWNFGDSGQTQYNTYGDVSARGLNGMWQETFSYDNGGRMWKSTAGDGTTRLYFYDGNGKQTLTIASSGAALPTGYNWSTLKTDQAITLLTNSGASTIGTYDAQGMVVTINVLDKRGQVTQTREPLRQISGDATSGYTTATITHSKTYNAFGEVTSETDARGNVTSFVYDRAGRLVSETDPSVSYTDEHGGIHTTQPVKLYYYDLSGRLVGVTDANGNTTTRLLLSGSGHDGSDPLVLKEFHADGGVYERKYDKYYDMRTTIDESSKTETYVYEAMDRLTEQDHQARSDNTQLVDHYGYDGLGHRTTHYNVQTKTDSSHVTSPTETTDYDMQGRVTRMVDMGGNTTTYGYIWDSSIATDTDLFTPGTQFIPETHTVGTGGLGTFGGWIKTTTTPWIATTETTDYFGRVVQKTGGAEFDYRFDLAGRTVYETSPDPDSDPDIMFSYYNTGLMSGTSSLFSYQIYDPRNGGFYHSATTHLVSKFSYDVDGNRTLEKYDSMLAHSLDPNGNPIYAAATLQNATISYDALNRMTEFVDTASAGTGEDAHIWWEYDKAGNIRHMYATYTPINADGSFDSSGSSNQNYWYLYDSMNRFVTTKGALVDGSGNAISQASHLSGTTGTIARSTTGTNVAYYHTGQRATATGADGTESYSYTEDGYLQQVSISGTVRSTYVRDALGRVVDYKEFDTNGTTRVYERTALYDNINNVTSDTVWAKRTDNTSFETDTTYDYKADSNSDGDYTDAGDKFMGGVITHSSATAITNGDTAHEVVSDTKTAYTFFDSAAPQQDQIIYTPDMAHPTITNITHYSYNGNGSLNGATITDGHPRQLTFITDAFGQYLERQDKSTSGETGTPTEYHYYANGIAVGDNSNNGTSNVDYASSIAQHRQLPSTSWSPFTNGSAQSVADFDQSYDPINGLTYATASSHYTVQDGETLQSIALAVWGDASFWYLLADANGLMGTETLVAGQDLIIPNKVHNAHNTNDVFRVYDPNAIIGNLTPNAPHPSDHNHCGVFGQVLTTIVAVTVTILTGGNAVLGDLASQLFGLVTGIQTSFNWKELALTEITADVGWGLGKLALIPTVGDAFVDGAIRYAESNVITQGIAVATGIQKHFDWAGVAAAGVVGGVTSWSLDELKNVHFLGSGTGDSADTVIANSAARRFVSGMAGAVAGAATRTLIAGTDFGDNLIAVLPDVIGNTIGNAVADRINEEPNTPPSRHATSSNTVDGSLAEGCFVPQGAPIDEVAVTPEAGVPRQDHIETVTVTADFDNLLPSPDDIISDAQFLNVGSNLYNVRTSPFWQAHSAARPNTSVSATPPYIPVISDIQSRLGDGISKQFEARELLNQRGWNRSLSDNLKLTAGAVALDLEGSFEKLFSSPLGILDATVGRALENPYKSRQDYSNTILSTGLSFVPGGVGGSLAEQALADASKVLPNQLRVVGETASAELTGLPKNSLRIPSASGAREYRVPDHMEPIDRRYIAETKNVKYQTLTSQILDDAQYVNRSGYPGRVDVIIDDRTIISTPLLREHLNPGSPIKITSTNLNAGGH